MEQYLDLVKSALTDGTYKPNRTGVDTIATFNQNYSVDMQDGFPLLTTKDMSGFRWNSLIHELIWYLSGEEHIRNLREETGIWDAWADEEGHLDTAYGRFWRRYPIPDEPDQLDGETWPDDAHRWTNDEGTFDQIQYVLDTLEENPYSRRMVVNAWHPANAATSTLPPCHYTYAFNVQDDELNVHLTQRSGDIALGIPFNIASYSILAQAVAQQTDFELGEFGHTIVDAHIYAGKGERGAWYDDNLDTLQEKMERVEREDEYTYLDVKTWVQENAPEQKTDKRGKPYDHVPGLLEQLSRKPRDRPELEIADKPLDALEYDDIQLTDYDPHDGLDFGVAE